MSLDDTVTLITGGGGALAGSVARAFFDAGSRLILVDLEPPEDRARTLDALPLGADLLDPVSADRVVREAFERHGRLDHVIHTVGGFAMQGAADATPTDYDQMFDLNMRSLFHVGRTAVRLLQEQGHGLLAGVSAGQAWNGGAAQVALYAASKAAVATWLRSVDAELRGTDVKVSVLYPMGVIDTEANRAAMPDADRHGWIDPDELARTLVHAASQGPRGRSLELPVWGGRKG
jgi:NAD(P)-dependent dehydrogenase (short-subunit alcohol dehydrogenase family)